jgi:uncharacterized damage-inducible protein DinB
MYAQRSRTFVELRYEKERGMSKKSFIGTICLAMAIPLLSAQETAKSDTTMKPASSPSQAILDSWNGIGRKLTAMAEDFPESKYDFKPNPAERSFAEQLLHAAGANYYFTNLARGEKPPAEEDPKREQYKTKADVVAFVKKSISDGAAAIQSKGDAGMAEFVTFPESHRQVRVSDLAYDLIEHSGEHYGQLVVYYRVAGLVPPESRPKK